LRLAAIDEQHFITACRHGLVHLTWERITVRFSREEFRRLAGLLARAADSLPPASLRDGELRVTYRQDDNSELRMGALILLLSPQEFDRFGKMAAEAVSQLDKFLASKVWEREEEEDTPPGFWEPTRRNPFSHN